jgi:hypothetical protein
MALVKMVNVNACLVLRDPYVLVWVVDVRLSVPHMVSATLSAKNVNVSQVGLGRIVQRNRKIVQHIAATRVSV